MVKISCPVTYLLAASCPYDVIHMDAFMAHTLHQPLSAQGHLVQVTDAIPAAFCPTWLAPFMPWPFAFLQHLLPHPPLVAPCLLHRPLSGLWAL